MKAIVHHRYGVPGGIELRDVDKPANLTFEQAAASPPGRSARFRAPRQGTGPARAGGADHSELLEAGKVTPVIDRRYALGYLGEGHARGKVVITV